MKKTWSDEALAKALTANTTISGVLRTLGLSTSPGNFKTLHRHILRLGLDTSHLLGKAHGSSGSGKKPLTEVMVIDSTYLNTGSLRRRMLKEGLLVEVCAKCSAPPTWQGERLTLQLDHINGDPFDNRHVNLRLLCPNCHSQTKNYTGRNRSSRYRR